MSEKPTAGELLLRKKKVEKTMTADQEEMSLEELDTLAPNVPFMLPTAEELKYIDDTAEMIVKSNFFGESNLMSAKVKVQACLRLKVDPLLFYQHIQIIDFKGKKVLTQSAYLVGFLILRSFPHAIKEQKWGGQGDDYGFYMVVQRPGRKIVPFSFTVKDALDADLLRKDNTGKIIAGVNANWGKYFKDMCRSRAYTRCGRTEFQDVLGGVIYSPEDFDQHFEEAGQ